MSRELRKLAKAIFLKTKNDIWLGGQRLSIYRAGRYENSNLNWPKGMPEPKKMSENWIWTLSPIIVSHGMEFRVCLTGHPNHQHHYVYVMVDSNYKYPGGVYQEKRGGDFWDHWSQKVMKLEMEEGGKTSHIWHRKRFIKDIRDGPKRSTKHFLPEPEHVIESKKALEEFDHKLKHK